MINKSSKKEENGPIERIVISCVTFDTVKITDPIEYYDATKAYLIRYSQKDNAYYEYYERVLEILDEGFEIDVHEYGTSKIKEGTLNIEKKKDAEKVIKKKKIKKLLVEDVNRTVYDFQEMLKVIFSIMTEERSSPFKNKNPIYVNISAGTSEFSAAALIASLMFENIIVFSVPTDEYTIKNENEKLYYDEKGKFIGLAKSVKDPRPINSFKVPCPDIYDILALRKYSENSFPSATRMIKILEEDNLWRKPGEETPDPKKDALVNKKMRFQRQFIDKWMKDGLIEREGRGKYSLTAHGKFAIDTYYTGKEIFKE